MFYYSTPPLFFSVFSSAPPTDALLHPCTLTLIQALYSTLTLPPPTCRPHRPLLIRIYVFTRIVIMNNNNALPNDQNLVRHISDYYTTNEFNDKIKQIMGTTNNTNSDGTTDSTNNYNNNTFSLLHVNARSLNKNYDDLSTFLTTLKNFRFSVIGVTETWLHSNSPPIF